MSLVKSTRAWRAACSSASSLAARDGPVGRVLQDALALLDRLVGDLHRDDVDAVAREDLDDAGTHGAESDDANLGELSSHGRKSRRGCAPATPARGVTLPTRPPLGWTGASRHSPVQRRLRRSAHRPPPARDPAARRQGRRLGARAQRRRLLQAAQLDVAAVHDGRGRARRGPDRRRDRRRLAGAARQERGPPHGPHPRGPARLRPRGSASTRASSRTASRRTCSGCSPSTSTPSATAGRSCAAST